jgi:hypothetical protein
MGYDRILHLNKTPTASAAYSNFIARTSGLDATHLSAYEALLNGLTSAGFFDGSGASTKLNCLYIFGTQNSTTAKLNLVQNNFNCTYSGVPSEATQFAADRGYTGNAANVYLDTGFNPRSSGAGIYTQNSASIGVYCRTSDTANRLDDILGAGTNSPTAFTVIRLKSSTSAGNLEAYVNSGFTGSFTANSNAQGNYVFSRTASTGFAIRKNEASFATYTATSSQTPNVTFTILAQNNLGTKDSFDRRQVFSAFFGAGLTSTESDAIAHAINVFATTVGASVY